MKKLNNKGFTLIELLAVLVILVVIMSIAIPSITSSVERNKAKQRKEVIKIIESAGELYADRHKNTFTQVSVPTLIDEGYLTLDDAKDPMNENFTIDIRFTVGSNNSLVSEEHDGFKVALKDENGNNIDEVEYCRNYN